MWRNDEVKETVWKSVLGARCMKFRKRIIKEQKEVYISKRQINEELRGKQLGTVMGQ